MQRLAEFWAAYGALVEGIIVFALVAALNALASPPADGKGESTLVLALRHLGPDLLGFLRARAEARSGGARPADDGPAPTRPSRAPYEALVPGQPGRVLTMPSGWVYPPDTAPPPRAAPPHAPPGTPAEHDPEALLRTTLNLSPPPTHVGESDPTAVESLEAIVARFERSRGGK